MKTTARVHDVRDGRAWLACAVAQSACAACSGGRGCALRWLARPEGAMLQVPAHGAGGAPLVPGDGVTLEVSDGELLRVALLAYLPPLAGLLAGPAIARVMLPEGEVASLLTAVAGLAAGWGASRAWLRRSPPRYRLQRAEAP